jgi:predicted enzyme related to lactoylglutathione lyase
MKPNPVGWFEIYVREMSRARRFYEAVFETTLERLSPPPSPTEEAPPCDEDVEMWAFPMTEETYGAPGALVQIEGMTPGSGGTLVYFSCEDCSIEAARAAEHGGNVLRDKMPIGEYGFIALINDSEGNMIGLHSMQ